MLKGVLTIALKNSFICSPALETSSKLYFSKYVEQSASILKFAQSFLSSILIRIDLSATEC